MDIFIDLKLLVEEFLVNKDSVIFRFEVDQLEVSADILLKTVEKLFEFQYEEVLVLLIGHLIISKQISLPNFWNIVIRPIFEAIDDLLIDIIHLISSLVTILSMLIKKAKVNLIPFSRIINT